MLTAQCKEVKGVLIFCQYQLEGLLCSLILQYVSLRVLAVICVCVLHILDKNVMSNWGWKEL